LVKRNAAAIATLLPNQTKANALIKGNDNVVAEMAKKEVLLVGLLGVAYSENGGGLRAKYKSAIDLVVDMNGKTNTNLLMGLFGINAIGDHGFDVLNFEVTVENLSVENITFNDLNTAEIYFKDNILNFGTWNELIGANNILDIGISLELTEQHLGQGFSTQFATAASTAVVPISAAIWLFGSGMLGLLTFARRRK